MADILLIYNQCTVVFGAGGSIRGSLAGGKSKKKQKERGSKLQGVMRAV